jgi:hypothetical protein
VRRCAAAFAFGSKAADACGDVAVKRLRRIVHAKKVTQALSQHSGPLAGYLRNVRIVLNRSDDSCWIIDALGPVVAAPELKQALRIQPKSRRAA